MEKGELIEKEGERINNIFQDVCFLNPSLTSHQKGRNNVKRFILQSCKHMQKGNIVFEKGHSKKKLDKKGLKFFEQKANTETRDW